MAKKKGIEVSLDLTKEEAREVARAIDGRLKELDGLFKAAVRLESRDAMEGVAKAVKLVTAVRKRIDSAPASTDANAAEEGKE